MHDAIPEPAAQYLPLKPVILQILVALAEGASHGYGVAEAVRQRSDGRVRLETGPLYRHLKRLLDDGLIEESLDRPADADRRRGAYYGLTPLGRRVIAAESARLADLLSLTSELGLLPDNPGG